MNFGVDSNDTTTTDRVLGDSIGFFCLMVQFRKNLF